MSSCEGAALRWEEAIHVQHARFAGKGPRVSPSPRDLGMSLASLLQRNTQTVHLTFEEDLWQDYQGVKVHRT
jgi:hypothetical protein